MREGAGSAADLTRLYSARGDPREVHHARGAAETSKIRCLHWDTKVGGIHGRGFFVFLNGHKPAPSKFAVVYLFFFFYSQNSAFLPNCVERKAYFSSHYGLVCLSVLARQITRSRRQQATCAKPRPRLLGFIVLRVAERKKKLF